MHLPFRRRHVGPFSASRLPSSLVAASLVALLVACGGSSEPESGSGSSSGDASGGARELRVSQGSDVLSFDPYANLESPTLAVQVNVFDPLTDIDASMNIVPRLAESWKNVSPTEWEFKLRQGVKFHEGQPFDAEDVRFSIRRAIDWAPSRLRSEIPTFKDARVVDPHTVVIETTVPDAIVPTRLASLLIMDKESTEAIVAAEGDAGLAGRANGTGPYRLLEWRKDSHTLLEANADYWGGAPPIGRMRFLATSNPQTRTATILSGDVDVVCNIPAQDVERIRAAPGYRVIEQPSLRLIYLGLDTSRDKSPGVPASPPNPLKDVRVRRAIYRAIDIDLVIRSIMNGQAAPAAQLFPEVIFGFDPTIKRPAYDVAEAKKLLAEAGFAKGFKVRLDTPNDRYVNDSKVAAAIAQQLAQVGIEVELAAAPKARFFTLERQGECSFFLIGWANTNGDGNGTFDHLLHTPDKEKNLGGSNTSTLYSNAELDRLSEEAAQEFDVEKRRAMLQQASRIAMEDLPHIPLHFQMDLYAVSEAVEWKPRRDTQVRGMDVRWR